MNTAELKDREIARRLGIPVDAANTLRRAELGLDLQVAA